VSARRAAALSARLAAERGQRLDRAFADAAARRDQRDRAFAYELTFGVTRLRGRLDHLLAPHVRRGLDNVEPALLEILRLGAYQLLYMDGVPTYAAVSETVEQARAACGPRTSGFVNAVLRRVAEAGDGPEHFPSIDADPAGFLASWGSHPRWLVERWLERWPVTAVRRLVDADNARPAVCLVPLEGDPAAAVARLGKAGVEAGVVGHGTRCVRLRASRDVASALEATAPSIVQDPAANLVSVYADVPSGTMVADLCAAPGGKALALSGRQLGILAADRSESRIHVMRDNARRVGRSVAFVVADATRPPLRGADVVMLDVPCTGTGTLARHPDGRWRLSPESVVSLADVQARMLEAAAEVVRPGGLLVYSTCTLEPEENAHQVEAFLSAHPEYRVEPTEAVPAALLDGSGCLEVTPQDLGFDGSFAARLRRAA
jgi:16S rRNA (cytosine967-C5)-methyltransferase